MSAAVLLASLAGAPAVAAGARATDAVDGRYIVSLDPASGERAAVLRRLEAVVGVRAIRQLRTINGFSARLSAAQLAGLRAHPAVASVVPDYRVRAVDATAIAAGDSAPAGTRRIEAATTAYVHEASSVRVAVVDTGIDLDHPDLNVEDGVNCVSGGAADDDNGHGTHVAGTIGARNNGAGVTGVAPGTRLVAVKVLDAAGDGSWSSIICGIDWITATRTDADPANDIAVVNMSLGGPGPAVQSCSTTTDAMHRAICAAVAAGVTFVVAAGNSGWDFDYAAAPDLPAAYPEVLTVTAMTDTDGRSGAAGAAPSCTTGERDDTYATYSNFAATAAGRAHTIAGPGTCVSSTWPGGGYRSISGTSMATPHVAGAVALCFAEDGENGPCAGLTPAQVIGRMRATAESKTTATSGYGFSGDPLRPVSGRYYGYLAHVGIEEPAPPPPPTTTTLSPIAATIDGGSLRSGGYAKLASNDGKYLEVNSTTKSTYLTSWYATFAGVERDLTALSVAYRGSNTRTCTQVVALWSWSTGSWVTLDSRSVGTSEVLVERAAQATLASYVGGTGDKGDVRVRVRCSTTAGTFRARADQLRLTFTAP
jgi:subtilisin